MHIDYALLSTFDKFVLMGFLLILFSIAAALLTMMLRRSDDFTLPLFGIKLKSHRKVDLDSFIDLIFLQQDVCDKHYQIGRVEIMKEQMDMAEDTIDAFISEVNKRYVTALSKSLGERSCISMEYVTFTSVGKQARFYILDKFRHMFKENHILTKTADEFATYIDNNTILIETEFRRHYQDLSYIHSESAQVVALLEDVAEDLHDITADIIKNARVVKETKCRELDGLWQAFVLRYKEILGRDPVIKRPDVL